ncbi:transposon Ty3-I Gag-Pol polyprotein [Trichonephila clavata]|uniref:Transposon Ty3-I Gag-Pol polyprotein n=1 Tax=Trichonephila clavata TaxID=2740835 RepID=A0A8X6KST8_TRICU|nr:transposon Ty3-I Gag-Pol polyprotein [Trichonephila clavata]
MSCFALYNGYTHWRSQPQMVLNIYEEHKVNGTFRGIRLFNDTAILEHTPKFKGFLKGCCEKPNLIIRLFKRSKKREMRKIQWKEEAEKQFENCKKDLRNTVLLSFPNPDLTLALFTDASDAAKGSVLQQFENDTWKPIGFY